MTIKELWHHVPSLFTLRQQLNLLEGKPIILTKRQKLIKDILTLEEQVAHLRRQEDESALSE